MSKRKYKPKKHRRPIRPPQQSADADYWLGELEKRLNGFGASSSDLPELDSGSCKSNKQHQHALRMRARFLVHRIREIEVIAEGQEAECLFGDLMERVALINDGPGWFTIEKTARRKQRKES